MDDIRGMVDRLPELSEDELGELESSIIQAFEAVEGQDISRESVAEMTFLADSVENVRTELGRRESEKAELAAEAAQAATRIQSAPTEEGATEAAAEGTAEASAEATPAEKAKDPKAPPETFAATEVTAKATPATELTSGGKSADEEEEPEEELSSKKEAVTELAPIVEEEPTVEEIIQEIESGVGDIESGVGEIESTEPLIEALPIGEAPAEELLPEEEEEPVFATSEDATATSTEAQMSNATAEPTFSAPADRLPVPRAKPAPISLVAGGDIPGVSAGSPLKDRLGLAEAMSMRLHSLRRASGGSGEQVVVASLLAEFPEDRTMRGNESDTNSAKLKAVVDPSVIVASGGWCAPLPVNYDLFDIGGSTDTPVRDSLPVFNADRGGIRYVKTPTFGDYYGAFGIWTNDNDIAAIYPPAPGTPPAPVPPVPGDATAYVKPCLHVGCAEEEEVYLEAVTMCLCFGNMQTRAFPELIARHNDLALVAAARWTEQYLLDKIKALSTGVTLPAVLGTARDILIEVERAASAYRYNYRLDPNLPLVFMAPQWLHAMIRSDLTAQLPGDGLDTTFNLANATIDAFFTHRNVKPVWTLETASTGQTPTVVDYPDTIEWALFAEGTFTLLDGGTLDIGIVRDMGLVSTNDYCMFTEQFLQVAKTGLDGLWIQSYFNVNGASAGTLDVSAVDY